MDGDDGVEFFLGHLVENTVAQNTRVIDHTMQSAERILGLLDHPLRGVPIGNALVVKDGFAAFRPDCVDHFLSRSLIVTFAVGTTTEIVYDHFRAMFRHHHGNAAPNSTAKLISTTAPLRAARRTLCGGPSRSNIGIGLFADSPHGLLLRTTRFNSSPRPGSVPQTIAILYQQVAGFH